MESKKYTTAQAATILGVSQVYVIQLINRGRISANKFGAQYEIMASDLVEYMTTRKPVGRPRRNAI